MARFNIAEAKAHFSKLVNKAMLGEEVIIARDNKPLVKLVPVNQPEHPRTPGSGRGQILYIDPEFDATPDEFEDYI